MKKRKEKIVCSQTSEIETGRTCTMILLCCQLFSKFVRPVKIAYLKSNIIPIRGYTPFSRVIFQLLHNILRYLYIYILINRMVIPCRNTSRGHIYAKSFVFPIAIAFCTYTYFTSSTVYIIIIGGQHYTRQKYKSWLIRQA